MRFLTAIFLSGDAQAKMGKVTNTKGTFQKKLAEMKKKIKQTNQDANACDTGKLFIFGLVLPVDKPEDASLELGVGRGLFCSRKARFILTIATVSFSQVKIYFQAKKNWCYITCIYHDCRESSYHSLVKSN